MEILEKTINTGFGNIFAMLSGTLLLENIKMEKQRTNQKYNIIFKNFYKNGINGYLTGFFPMGMITGFVKGCSIGLPYGYLDKKLNWENQTNKKIFIGLCTGITESIFLNPILISRNITNKLIQNNSLNIKSQFSETNKILKQNLIHNKFYLLKGLDLLIFKRSTDWILRFYFISKLEKSYLNYFQKDKLNYYDKIFTTFFGASITMPFSTPFDRFLPLIYEKNYDEIKKIIKSRNIKNLYAGGIARFFNIGLFTTFTLCAPQIVKLT